MLVHTTAPTTTHTQVQSTNKKPPHRSTRTASTPKQKKLVTPSFLTRETIFVGKFADIYAGRSAKYQGGPGRLVSPPGKGWINQN